MRPTRSGAIDSMPAGDLQVSVHPCPLDVRPGVDAAAKPTISRSRFMRVSLWAAVLTAEPTTSPHEGTDMPTVHTIVTLLPVLLLTAAAVLAVGVAMSLSTWSLL